jgi:hypothetical protein
MAMLCWEAANLPTHVAGHRAGAEGYAGELTAWLGMGHIRSRRQCQAYQGKAPCYNTAYMRVLHQPMQCHVPLLQMMLQRVGMT